MGLSQHLNKIQSFRVKKGDAPSVAARSELLNSLADAVASLAKGENIGKSYNLLKRVSQGSFTLRARRSRRGRGAAVEHPFKVSDSMKDEYVAIAVNTGLVMNQIPYMEGELMNKQVYDAQGNLVQNTITPPDKREFSVWLMTRLKASSGGYHPKLDMGEGTPPTGGVKPPAQSCYITCDDPVEKIDFRVKWDNEANKDAGIFAIKLADVTTTEAPPGTTAGPVITSITQFVFENFRVLALMGNDAIPLG